MPAVPAKEGPTKQDTLNIVTLSWRAFIFNLVSFKIVINLMWAEQTYLLVLHLFMTDASKIADKLWVQLLNQESVNGAIVLLHKAQTLETRTSKI